MSAQSVVFFNPWERLIGPNRYLVEHLRQSPPLARAATVILGPTAGDAAEEYRSLGCRVELWPECALVHPRADLRNLAALLRDHSAGLFSVCRRLRALAPSLIVSNTENFWLGGLAARRLGLPHAQVVHSLAFEYRWGRYPRLVCGYAGFLSALADAFVAVSESVAGMLRDLGIPAAKVRLAPNSFEPERVRREARQPLPQAVSALLKDRTPLLVSVGRTAPMKGQDVLVEALAAVRREHPELACVFVGRDLEGSVEDVDGFKRRLDALIARDGLERSVIFLGESDCVPSLLARADVYVHPSRTESFSRVVAEALLCGKPVVCSDAGALPEVVGDEGACLVPPGDARALSEALLRVLRDAPFRDRLARTGRTHVERRYAAGNAPSLSSALPGAQ